MSAALIRRITSFWRAQQTPHEDSASEPERRPHAQSSKFCHKGHLEMDRTAPHC
jgi:hypothetical protein